MRKKTKSNKKYLKSYRSAHSLVRAWCNAKSKRFLEVEENIKPLGFYSFYILVY